MRTGFNATLYGPPAHITGDYLKLRWRGPTALYRGAAPLLRAVYIGPALRAAALYCGALQLILGNLLWCCAP